MAIFRQLTRLKPTVNRFLVAASILSMLLSSLAIAEPITPSVLSWREAVSRTLENNPGLQAFGFQLAAQTGRLQQTTLKPNPELTLAVENAFGSGEFQGMDSAEASLSISWVLEGQQRRARVSTAQARMSVLEVERDIQRLDAAAVTARLYISLLALQARAQQSEQAIELARDAIKVIEGRVNAGKSPTAEAARAKVNLSRHLLEQEDIVHERAVVKRQLAAQWGATSADFEQVAGDISALPNVASYDVLQVRLQQNPRLQYFVTNARWEESQLALIKAQSKPQWRISAGIKHLAATDDQALIAGISVPLTVFDRQQGRVTEARAMMELSRAQREAEQIHLGTALYGLHQELLHSLHIAKSYRQDILPALEIALKDTRRAYDLGRYSYLEWQAVQREFLEAKNILIETNVAAHLNAIEIERLTGVEITPHSEQP